MSFRDLLFKAVMNRAPPECEDLRKSAILPIHFSMPFSSGSRSAI